MKRAAVISLCLVSVALIVACSRHDEQADTSKKSIVDLAIHPPAPVVPTPVVVTGCLMGAGTEFIIATPGHAIIRWPRLFVVSQRFAETRTMS